MTAFPQTNRFHIPVLLFCVISASGQTASKALQNKREEFEGIIKYKMTYSNNNEVSTLFGDTMTLYYSKGNMIRQYNGTSEKGLKREIFLTANSGDYMDTGVSDSLIAFDITKERNYKLESAKLSSAGVNILGHACEKMEFYHTYQDQQNSYINTSYLYSKDVLSVNKIHFKDWNYLSFNKFIDQSGSLYLQIQVSVQLNSKGNPSTTTATAVDIKEQHLDEKIFSIDTSKAKQFKVQE